MRRAAAAACALLALTASAQRSPVQRRALASLGIASGPYFPQSRIVPQPRGMQPPYALFAQGAADVEGGAFVARAVSAPAAAELIGGNAAAIAASRVSVVPPPAPDSPLVAVASYDDGVVLHDAVTMNVLGTLAIGGAAASVAFDAAGNLAAADTSGDTVSLLALQPWSVRRIGGVPLGNEVAVGPPGSGFFVSDRSVDGRGALTRIAADGSTARVATGDTAEGIAVDDRRGIVYVGNVNDGSVLAVDARSMRPLRRIAAVPRVFGIALSSDGDTLYAVANQSATSQFRTPGYVAAFDLRRPNAPRIARSADLRFPLEAALDSADGRLFVTDESADRVYVLDARTLRAVRAPLATCAIPWKPYYDATAHRVLVPCAGANRIDAFDARTLRRIPGAPFATGGYPLAVSVWRPPSGSER